MNSDPLEIIKTKNKTFKNDFFRISKLPQNFHVYLLKFYSTFIGILGSKLSRVAESRFLWLCCLWCTWADFGIIFIPKLVWIRRGRRDFWGLRSLTLFFQGQLNKFHPSHCEYVFHVYFVYLEWID